MTGTAVESGVQRRIMAVLVVSQVFGTIGATAGYTVAAVAAVALAGSASAAGVAQAAASVGTVAAAALLSRIADSRGRRVGLSIGYVGAALGAGLCVVAIGASSFLLFAIGGCWSAWPA
jgi:MFS family permease